MKKHLPKRIAIWLLILTSLLTVGHAIGQTNSNPDGFEDGTIIDWTGGGGTETAASNTTNTRTGAYSLALTTSSTSGNKYWYSHAPYANTPVGTYVHFIYWAQSSVASTSVDASMRFATTNPPTGTGTTANGTATAITTSTWTRVSFGGQGNSASRNYFPAPRRTTSNAATIYIDDLIVYTSNSTTTDLTNPTAASSATGTFCSGLSWTNGADAGTGIQSTLLFKRTGGTNGSNDLILNNQGQYSLTSSVGPSIVGNWTLVDADLSSTATSYTGGTFSGSEEYAIVHRDLAYNYSLPTYAVISTCGPNTPPVINPQSFSVDENSANGKVVGSVVATDSDPGQTLSYSITAGNTGDVFAISSGGEITVSSAIDYESLTSYNLSVQVSDNGAPIETASATITVNINNITNENAPVLNDEMFSIVENSGIGIVLGTVVATDADGGQTLAYSIIGGNTNNALAINTSTGAITVAGSLNYESKTLYVLTVQASDNGTPVKSSTATVLVSIVDINENPNTPVISAQNFSVPENTSNGTSVNTVIASDADAAQVLSYSITAGNTGNVFVINSTTGEITVSGSLNFEAKSVYDLTVKVIDNGEPAKNASATITINVANLDETPSIGDKSFSVNENVANGTVVGTVIASDPEGQTLSYSILSGNTDNAFAINSTTGEITVAGTLDFENTFSYSLSVEVSDNGNQSSATITININNLVETGIVDADFNSEIKLFPNPTKNILNIESDNMNLSGAKVKVLNSYGVVVLESDYNIPMNLDGINSGMYTVIITHKGKTAVQKLMIE